MRTLRTFSHDRAAAVAPVLYFLCAKEMTPIIMWPAFGAPLLIRIALSALGASCDCACYDQYIYIYICMMHRGCGRPVRTLRTVCDDRAAPVAPVLYVLCAKEMTPIIIIWWAAFGAPLLIRSALSALDASCDCAWHDQA